MRPATRLTFVVVTVIALLHLVRLAVGVSVVVGGGMLPRWPSAVAALFFGGLAIGLWREHSTGAPAT